MVDPAFDRPVATNVVVLMARAAIAKEALEQLVHPLLHECSLKPSDVTIDEAGPGKRYSVRFHGESGLAARRAGKLLSIAKRDSNGWRQLQCRTPGDLITEVNVDSDKNPKQTRAEFVARKTKQALAKLTGSRPRVKDGIIEVNFQPVCKVEYVDSKFEVKYNLPLLSSLGTTRDDMEKALAFATADPAERVQWG